MNEEVSTSHPVINLKTAAQKKVFTTVQIVRSAETQQLLPTARIGNLILRVFFTKSPPHTKNTCCILKDDLASLSCEFWLVARGSYTVIAWEPCWDGPDQAKVCSYSERLVNKQGEFVSHFICVWFTSQRPRSHNARGKFKSASFFSYG